MEVQNKAGIIWKEESVMVSQRVPPTLKWRNTENSHAGLQHSQMGELKGRGLKVHGSKCVIIEKVKLLGEIYGTWKKETSLGDLVMKTEK